MPTSETRTLKTLFMQNDALGFDHIKSITAPNSHLASFLKAEAFEDVYRRTWDFDGNGILDDFWVFTADAGATGFAIPATQDIGGIIQGATGAIDNNGFSMLGQPVVKGDNHCIFHCHFLPSAVTSFQFEVGLVDAVTDKTLPVVTDVDTPASGNGASNLAVVHMDTDQTLTTMAFVADGLTMNCAKRELGILVPSTTEHTCVRIMVDGDDAVCRINNSHSTYYKTLADNIEGGTKLRPWLYFRTRTATSRTVSVDLVEIMTERN